MHLINKICNIIQWNGPTPKYVQEIWYNLHIKLDYQLKYIKPVYRIISMSMPLQSQLQNVKEMRQLKLKVVIIDINQKKNPLNLSIDI